MKPYMFFRTKRVSGTMWGTFFGGTLNLWYLARAYEELIKMLC